MIQVMDMAVNLIQVIMHKVCNDLPIAIAHLIESMMYDTFSFGMEIESIKDVDFDDVGEEIINYRMLDRVLILRNKTYCMDVIQWIRELVDGILKPYLIVVKEEVEEEEDD